MMSFKDVEEKFKQLKSQFVAGQLSELEFKARLKEMMFQDDQGRWWMIGYETGLWYYNDGINWVKSEPPGFSGPEMVPETPSVLKTAKPSLGPADKPNLPAASFVHNRRRLLWLIAGAIVLLCIIGLVWKIITPPTLTPTATATLTPIPNWTSTPTYTSTITPTQATIRSITDGKWIAYAFGPTQNKRDLYMINWQTKAKKRITSGGHGDLGPNFSPDGSSLVFSRCETGTCKIVVRDGNGIETQLTDDNAMWPSWCKNPSKPWIIYENQVDGGKTNIGMIDLDTRKQERLTNGGNDAGPEWSPDCSLFSFTRGEDIYIFDMSTKSANQLTFAQDSVAYSTYAPRWSPDGAWLVYNIVRDTDGDGILLTDGDVSDLMIIRTDGSGQQNLTNGQYWAFSPSWSPDGSKIVFADYKLVAESQLVYYDMQQQSFTAITDSGPFNHPVWGP